MNINKESFLKLREQFQLGSLSTEGIHSKTRMLSDLCNNDLASAIALLQEVDKEALEVLKGKLKDIYALSNSIKGCLENGGKLFMSGCGATGRLSLAIETFWRKQTGRDNVFGFMAGGDYALIRSVERFEDKMSYGHRQLEDLGFGKNDLLLAITEGGETSFVIGSALAAIETSKRKPYFIYCNPDSELDSIERSKDIIKNEGIEKLNLAVGPMAISGSTRMQATTVQMLAVVLALFSEEKDEKSFTKWCEQEIELLQKLNFQSLSELIEIESALYKANKIVTYKCPAHSSITILTDTTERSPTFSLAPFEKTGESVLSWAYLSVKGAASSEEAWEQLLQRKPRGLSWPDLDIKIDYDELLKFDISEMAMMRRSGECIDLLEYSDCFEFLARDKKIRVPKTSSEFAISQIGLKMAMNILSTIIMGRLGRYRGNMMTFVRPSNYKLIDRAARYVIELGKDESLSLDYLDVVEEIFRQIPQLGPDDAVVEKTLESFKKN